MASKAAKGNCYICGHTFSKSGMKKHILTHEYSESDKQPFIILKIEDLSGMYWLFLDIPYTTTLKTLDSFLREIWLGCCGHLCAFYINGYQEISTNTKVSSFLQGTVLRYEYDFGSTTELKITLAGYSSRKKQKKAVRLLARNGKYEFNCQNCGKTADYICCECMWGNGNPFLCEDCAGEHDHECMLPVVNSPRMGVCGYDGILDKYVFDPKKIEKLN